MSKLGYTWYAKDWRSNMDVSELSLQEKGFYRELIDECFLKNSSKIQINERTFCRLHGINSRTFGKVLQKLCESSLIVIENFDDYIISIPSTSKRLGVVDTASNGGKKSSRLGVKNVTKSKEKSNTKSNTKEEGQIKPFSDFDKAFSEFKKMRGKMRKPLTERAEQLIKAKIKKITSDGKKQIQILEQSIVNSWADVYELKAEKNNKPKVLQHDEDFLKNIESKVIKTL